MVLGLGFATTAAAQSARVEMVPMPASLPQLLFAPDPIAGTMLKPLRESSAGPTEIDPEPNPQAVIQAQAVTESPAAETTGAIAPAAPETLVTSEAPTAATESAPPAAPLQDASTGATQPEGEAATALAAPGAPAAVPEEPATAAPPGSSVHIIVENVATASGIVNVAVCDKGLSEEACPYKTSVPAGATGFVEAKLDGVPPGTYAVVGYHDVNGNDEFDTLLGIPREPYALSSEAAETLVPRFQDAALPIHAGENVVIIRLKTFGGG